MGTSRAKAMLSLGVNMRTADENCAVTMGRQTSHRVADERSDLGLRVLHAFEDSRGNKDPEEADITLAGYFDNLLCHRFGARSALIWRRDEGRWICGYEEASDVQRLHVHAEGVVSNVLDQHWGEARGAMTRPVHYVSLPAHERREACSKAPQPGIIMVPVHDDGGHALILTLTFSELPRLQREEEILLHDMARLANAIMRWQNDRHEAYSARLAGLLASERRRFARDAHDTFAQEIAATVVQLHLATSGPDDEVRAEHVRRATVCAESGLSMTREWVARLRSGDTERCGEQPVKCFVDALRTLLGKISREAGLCLRFSSRPLHGTIDEACVEEALKILREAVTNVAKHAGANTLCVDAHSGARRLTVILSDDGCGFDRNAPHDGYGLVGMAERARLMNATLEIWTEPGRGTVVTLVMPTSGLSMS